MLLENRQGLDLDRERAIRGVGIALKAHAAKVHGLAGRLEALSPLRVLSRGYSVVTRQDGSAVRDGARLSPGECLSIRFHRGAAQVRVEKAESDTRRPKDGQKER